MSNLLTSAVKRILLLLTCVLGGTLLLCAAFLLPQNAMEENAARSSDILSREGSYPVKWGEEIGSTLDNFTDALMIQNAVFPSSGNVLADAVSVYHMQYGDSMDPVTDLAAQTSGAENGYPAEYMRYWHGYLIFLKPLLLILDYSGIRILNAAVQIILFALLILLMKKRGLTRFILPFILSWLGIAPWTLPYSMQFSVMYYISMTGSVVLLLFYERIRQHLSVYFMALGIAAAYFDYLTWPLISFGLPLIFCLLLSAQSVRSPRELLLRVIRMAVLGLHWAAGYGGMWASKWVLSELVLHQGAISQALGAAAYRASADSEGAGVAVTALLVWTENVKRVFNPAFCAGIVVYAACLIHEFITVSKKSAERGHILAAAPFLLTAALPLIWYALIKNHSFVHLSLVYRSLWISIFAGMCSLLLLCRQSPGTVRE